MFLQNGKREGESPLFYFVIQILCNYDVTLLRSLVVLELLNFIVSGKKKEFTGEEVQKLLASDGADSDNFGFSTSISTDGSVIIVGSYCDDDNGGNSGSVYVFNRQSNGNYIQSQKLLASDGAANDYFSFSISISSDGSVIAVGSAYADAKGNDSGAAYVFTKQANGSYAQSQKLTATDGSSNDYFGISVSISGDGNSIVVGAYCDDDKGADSGSVYVFTKQANGNYIQHQKLNASDGTAYDYFGFSTNTNTNGSVIVIGAYNDDSKSIGSGSVYVFTRKANGFYTQSQKLLASDGASGDYFGYSVSVSADGSVIAAGAFNDDDRGTDSGSVYVFTRQANEQYVHSQKLTAFDGAAGDYFGGAISTSGDGYIIAVSAHGDDDKGNGSGTAYVFTKQANGQYTLGKKLTAFDGAAGDQFSYSVSVSADGSSIVVGSYLDDDRGNNSGSVYVFN